MNKKQFISPHEIMHMYLVALVTVESPKGLCVLFALLLDHGIWLFVSIWCAERNSILIPELCRDKA